MALYKGYSSFQFQKVKSFGLTDIDLVDLDLLNNIYTRRGSRVMMPSYGTIIPELVFEPLTDDVVDTIESELTTVFANDPRVSVISLTVTPYYDQNTVGAAAWLNYIELNMTKNFELNIVFEAQ